MTFSAMLVKEMRLRMRRERTILLLVLYVLLLGLLAWLTLKISSTSTMRINQWSSIGYVLYHLLTAAQLLLILFITPAFTATAINGEKERQTYDMLLCSRLSSFSLVTGKLLAGLSTSLLLIAAAIPLFSLIFFLGGVDPLTVLQDLLTFVITAVLVGTLGFLCSALFSRPAISTAVTYMIIVLWLVIPLMLPFLTPTTNSSFYIAPGIRQTPTLPLVTAWNPLIALSDSFFLPFASPTILYTMNGVPQGAPTYALAGLRFTPQATYAIVSSLAIVFFFVLSLCFAKPNPVGRLRARIKRKKTVNTLHQDTHTTITT